MPLTSRRHYLMCPPEFFSVTYAINPWMDPTRPVDRDRALRQWDALRRTYIELGHEVDTIDPEPGLPDMVFAANGALVVDGIALGARFRHPERQPEADVHLRWLRAAGHVDARPSQHTSEGEGDFLVVGSTILAGTGFRTTLAAHREVAAVTGREVVSLRLVDPRYYHLDTALCALDDTTIAYLPEAFDERSREVLRRRHPDAVVAAPGDAAVLGLNAVSDGHHVVLPVEADGLARTLRARGFTPVPVELDELRKAGGGPKCCTLELRPAIVTEDREEVPA